MKARFGLALVFSTLGCATVPPPTETLANSMASVRGAEEVGATAVPEAALVLRFAQDEVARSKALMADKQHERAQLMALRASSDAELAIALVREHEARVAAQRASAAANER